MVEVICDTNFLIHLATRRIKNIDNLDMEIGSISFIVPEVVKNELIKLQEIPEKNQEITINNNSLTWNCSAVQPGIYLINIKHGSEEKAVKVVVK